ncbi:hypothetical protein XI06_39560 [Bradyrhizobium sp. CCBAU 11434]|nr:hypothetical protein [Bradyrhizobium sp. CCBAU 11434]
MRWLSRLRRLQRVWWLQRLRRLPSLSLRRRLRWLWRLRRWLDRPAVASAGSLHGMLRIMGALPLVLGQSI